MKLPMIHEDQGLPDRIIDTLYKTFQETGAPVEVDFRRLVDWVRLGDQLTHLIHPYPAKLLPNIAHLFLNAERFSSPCDAVLDPFCGTGTVALEASLSRRKAYIADANPLAVLIAKVKTRPHSPAKLRSDLAKILALASRVREVEEIEVVNKRHWYRPRNIATLERVRHAIHELTAGASRQFFMVCFSATARRLSNADPAISVPVLLSEKKRLSESANKSIRRRLRWLARVEDRCAPECYWRG